MGLGNVDMVHGVALTWRDCSWIGWNPLTIIHSISVTYIIVDSAKISGIKGNIFVQVAGDFTVVFIALVQQGVSGTLRPGEWYIPIGTL